MMKHLELLAPSKINLGLWVGPRRRDGYHDIVSVLVPLDFGDRIELRLATRPGLTVRTSDPVVPDGPKNLAFRAAQRFYETIGSAPACQISIEKRVPVGAGLGGGSSDAATVVLGLNRLHGEPLPPARLARIAARLGSDAPFFLLRAPAVVRGRGERLRPIRLPALTALLHLPGFPVSTVWAYRQLDRVRGRHGLTRPAPSPKILGLKLRQGQLEKLDGLLGNDFEAPVFARFPQLARVRTLMLECGLPVAGLSGSGSTVYGLAGKQGWQDPMAALERHGISCTCTSSLRSGE